LRVVLWEKLLEAWRVGPGAAYVMGVAGSAGGLGVNPCLGNFVKQGSISERVSTAALDVGELFSHILAGFCWKLLMVRNLIFWLEAPHNPIQLSLAFWSFLEGSLELLSREARENTRGQAC
jgi:hypothetical protein